MKDNIDVSFCIPAYNTKKYIEDCITSIREIKKFKYEIIVIDDSSTDNTYEYVCRLTNGIPELRVMKNEYNCGVSATRNKLIEQACGKWIAFIDSDDAIIPEAYEVMWEIMNKENIDAIIADYVEHRKGSLDYLMSIDVDPKIDFFNHKQTYTPAHVWGGLFNVEVIRNRNIRFRENISLYEDMLFVYEFMNSGTCRVAHLKTPAYIYRQLETSLLHGKRSEERKKEAFLSIYTITKVYASYLSSNIADKEATSKKLKFSKQHSIYYLIRIKDKSFFNKYLRCLKDDGLYPYPFIWETWTIKEPLWKRACMFLLPIQHFAVLLSRIVSNMER